MAQSQSATAAQKPLGQSASAVRRKARLRRHTRLRKKIERDPKFPRYLQTVRGIGYRLVTTP